MTKRIFSVTVATFSLLAFASMAYASGASGTPVPSGATFGNPPSLTDCATQNIGAPCVTSSNAAGTCQYITPEHNSKGCYVTTTAPTAPSSPAPNLQSTNSNGNTYTPAPSVPLINPLQGVDCSAGNGNCLSAFLLDILSFVIFIGSIVVVLMLVFVGFKFVAAQGAPEKLREAKGMLLWTIIGALVLLGAQAIAMGIQATVTAITGG